MTKQTDLTGVIDEVVTPEVPETETATAGV
jgi:hypothetical protein